MTNISINKLHEFKDHPYQVLDNDEMNSLIESVQQQGIMTPLIVRPLEGTTDEYEIISGHRRFRAAQKAGLTEVPAFIRPVSRDEAAIMVVDSNLHREHLLPSNASYRNHFISVVFMPRCWFRRKPLAHPVHLFDATAALRQERCERTHGAPLYAFHCNKYSISRLFCQFQAWAGRW